MASIRFREFEREVKRLRKQFLPKTFNDFGVYPPRFQTSTRAFLVLAHAAVESYLSSEAKRLTNLSKEKWEDGRKATFPLLHLVSANKSRLAGVAATGLKRVETLMDDFVRSSIDDHFLVIKNSNGVKEVNVLAMFGPLGFPSQGYGTMLLPELTSFGSDRGDHAHQSGAALALTSVLDPEIESNRVDLILSELERFDAQIRQFERTYL